MVLIFKLVSVAAFPLTVRLIPQLVLRSRNVGLLGYGMNLALTLIAWVVTGWDAYLIAGFIGAVWRSSDEYRWVQKREQLNREFAGWGAE